MAFADAVNRMKDRQYATMGVPARWTPAGGSPVDFTGLIGGGDQAASFHGLGGQMNVSARTLRARVSELAALAPGVAPAKGDVIALLNGDGSVAESFALNSAPRHPQNDARRLELVFTLGGA